MRIHWKTNGLSLFSVQLTACIAFAVVYYWFLITKILESHSHKNTIYKVKLNFSKNEEEIVYNLQPSNTSDALYETIHIAVLSSSPRMVTPMLKSLLRHRRNPLHLHLIVDQPSQQAILTLISSWNLTDIQCTLYDAKKLMPSPANRSGLVRGAQLYTALLPDVLPKIQLIVLDTDLTIICDVFELWKFFESMNEVQYIGMAKDQSRRNKIKNSESAYYDTGVMLLDLQKLERKSWFTLWNDTFLETKHTHPDRCIAKGSVRSVVYNIGCQYNLQMASLMNAKRCYGHDKRNVKILHWNAKNKGLAYSFRLNQLLSGWLKLDVSYFFTVRSLYLNLHKEKNERICFTEDTNEAIEYDDCYYFRRVKTATFLILSNYMNSNYTGTGNDVTLAVQLSVDRLLFLVRLCEFWDGPVSAAVYINYLEAKEFKTFVNNTKVLNRRNNIAYHLVYKQDCMPYPVNHLRNIALDNVVTPYVFLIDIDFVPSTGLYEYLKNSIRVINPYPKKKLLVIPAFQIFWANMIPPLTKRALLPKLHNVVFPFRSRYWSYAHRATNYSHWRNATEPYEVDWEYSYEPYFVAHRSMARFDVRFSGYGWNKVSHSLELRALGYSHVVLPNAYIVHTPHARSPDRFRYNSRIHKCVVSLRDEFLKDLGEKFNLSLTFIPKELWSMI